MPTLLKKGQHLELKQMQRKGALQQNINCTKITSESVFLLTG